jgi:murein L,D-transpeptidase YafK
MIRVSIVYLLVVFFTIDGVCQSSFISNQLSHPRVANAFKEKEDSLKVQLSQKGINWPVKQLYIRSFKYDSQLEVWARNSNNETFTLFKTYKVCALSGALGPKRFEGDYQVPEGFYFINAFNPNSNYHLSLGLNYPNTSDKIRSNGINPGGDIFIHGTCTTVGCIPLQNHQIEELYILAALTYNEGQQFIPVHIFPINFNNSKSLIVLQKAVNDDERYKVFTNQLKSVFDFFESTKKIPLIGVNKKGDYEMLSSSIQ